MKRHSTVGRDFVIGLVFLGALAAFGYGTLQVSVNILGRAGEIEVPFTEVNGIREGDDVRYYGHRVGIVTGVEERFQNPTHKLLVRCRMETKADIVLPEDSRFVVRTSSALGGRHVEIVRGESEQQVRIAEGSFTGGAERDVFDALGTLVDEIREGEGLLHGIIYDEEVGTDFAAIVSGVRQAVERIDRGEGIIGALINRPDLREQAEQIISDIQASARDIREGTGTLGMLINDSETRDRVRSAVTNIEEITRDLREGEGALRLLLNDPETRDRLKSAIENIDDSFAGVKAFVKDASEGDGTLAMLARDTEFKNDLKEGVSSMNEILSGINEGEGTLGQLVKNREAYDQLVRILDNVADAVEDFREQAPVSTFVNAIFTGL